MGRHLRILDLALSLQGQHKIRFALDCFVYILIVFLLASALFTTAALKVKASRLLANAPDLVVQRMTAGRHDWIPVGDAESIAAIRGIASVEPRLWGYYYDPPTRATYTVLGIQEVPTALQDTLEGGQARLENAWDCIIGIGVARVRMVEEGDIIPVKGGNGKLQALRVQAVFSARSQVLTNDLVILRESDWRELFLVPPDQATDLAVTVPNPIEVDTVAEKILELHPDSRPITRDLILKTYDALFSWRGSMVLFALLGSLAAFFILSWGRASSLSSEEARLLGILRGIGWDVSDIIELKIWQGISVSALSFLIGILAAHVHVFSYGCGLFTPFLQGWSVLFPEFQLEPAGEAEQILAILLLTVAPYTLATLVPAWKGASTDPDQAMRS